MSQLKSLIVPAVFFLFIFMLSAPVYAHRTSNRNTSGRDSESRYASPFERNAERLSSRSYPEMGRRNDNSGDGGLRATTSMCPNCGATLGSDGVCPECGWPWPGGGSIGGGGAPIGDGIGIVSFLCLTYYLALRVSCHRRRSEAIRSLKKIH